MAKKERVEIVEEEPARKADIGDDACPVCGAPGGKLRCGECGWGMEELGAELSTSLDDPVSTIMKARMSFSDMKKNYIRMKEQVDSLARNNKKFSELVEAMEDEIKRLRMEAGRKYVYSYGQGGWRQTDDVDRTKLHMKESNATLDDINRQLREITRLIERYRK